MKVTNKYGLPESIRKACEYKQHTTADFSVTQLLKGVCEIVLEKMNNDNLEIDCSESVFAIFGSAVHKILENEDVEGVEKEVYMTFTTSNGAVISGVADEIDNNKKTVNDYKTCAVWKIKFKDYDDWRKQLKSYCFLNYKRTGKMFLKGTIIALIKDWSPTDRDRDNEYPRTPIVKIEFDFTEDEILDVEQLWTEKTNEVNYILNYQSKLYECSEKEKWTKPPKFAVMKKGRKTAIKLFDSEDEAEELASTDKDYFVEHRKGEDTKCIKYCLVRKNGLCPFHKIQTETE